MLIVGGSTKPVREDEPPRGTRGDHEPEPARGPHAGPPIVVRLRLPEGAGPSALQPRVTFAILGILAVLFVAEAIAAKSASPSPAMLAALGGMSGPAVRAGEYHRLLTATLLHGDVLHIGMNGLALYYCGRLLEPLAGRSMTVVVYTLSALGGSLLSLLLNDANIVSVGASGAVMGVTAAAAVAAFRVEDPAARRAVQGALVRSLVLNLVPFANIARSGGKIDYAAHLGGALAGGAVGCMLELRARRRGTSAVTPFGARVQAVLAGLCAVAFAGALTMAALRFPREAAAASLDPKAILVDDDALPKQNPERTVEVWGKDRPRDPRVHFFRAIALLDADETERARGELRAALADDAVLRAFFSNGKLEAAMRALLARVLLEEGDQAEALKVAQPSCGVVGNDDLLTLGVCPGASPRSAASLLGDRCVDLTEHARYDLARRVCGRALAAARKGAIPLELAESLHATGVLQEAQAAYPEAALSYAEALGIWKQQEGPDGLGVALASNSLGVVEHLQGRDESAEALYRTALGIYTAKAPDGDELPKVQNNLGNLLSERGRLAEAQAMLQLALLAKEINPKTRPLDLAVTQQNLAVVLDKDHQRDAAEALYRKALATKEAALGKDHPSVATTLTNLGALLLDRKDYAGAEPLLDRALRIEETRGPDHPNLVVILRNQALVYEATKRDAEAERALRRALAIEEKRGIGSTGADGTRARLASLLRRTGRAAEAKALEH